jgi:hypothetical protein
MNCTNFIKLNHGTKLNKGQQITKYLLVFVLALTLSNCQVEEDVINKQGNIQTVNLNEAISFLKDNPVNINSKLSKKTTLLPDFNKITQEKVFNSDQLLTIIPLSTNDENQNSRVLLLKIDDEIQSVNFSMHPEENSSDLFFTGKIMIRKLNGDFINGFRVKNGECITQFVKTDKSVKEGSFYKGNGDSGGEGMTEVIIMNLYKASRSYYLDLASFIWNYSDGGNYEQFAWDSEGGASGGDSETPTEQIIEEQIKDSLDPCPKAVYEKLKNSTDCDIANVLQNLGATNKGIVIKMVSGTPDNNAIASTKYTTLGTKYDYTITMTQDYSDGTQLFKASVLLHELTHAFFLSLIDDYQSSSNQNVFIEFPILFQKFVDTNYPGSKADAHHEEMANKYVDAIGAALQEYQTRTPLAYGAKPDQIYTDMAWGGLVKTPIYDKKIPQGSAERARIENRYQAEALNRAVGEGTPSVQNPIGNPCN